MTTLLTAKQHRILAANLLKTAGTPGHPSKKQAEQMSKRHRVMANMIERRARLEAASQGRPASQPH
jgi:hypothetical protein